MPESKAYPPSRRLHYTFEYRRFFEKSDVIRISACTLFRIPNELGHYRLGITVKARVNSVQRNKLKRTIREAFRQIEPLLGSFDYNVVIPGQKKAAHPFPLFLAKSLKEELPRALSGK